MTVTINQGDALQILKTMQGESVNCCVTSPPYWGLRDYGVEGQLGLERTPDEYVAKMVEVFREVRRVLRDDGTLWLNLGDSYNANQGAGFDTNKDGGERKRLAASPKLPRPQGIKPKDLVGIPWMVAFALRSDGWYLRQDIIWSKLNPMPESVTDRCTKSHEYIFLLSKSQKYYYDAEAIKEPQAEGTFARYKPGEKIPTFNKEGGSDRKTKKFAKSTPIAILENGRNKRSVWTVATAPFPGAHFATFPPKLIEPCILAGCPSGGTVLDPFAGSGTTGMVAEENGRNSVLIELNPKYVDMIRRRTAQIGLFCGPIAMEGK